MLKFKVKDKVIVLSGKDKGKIGIITKVIKKNKSKFFLNIEGINIFKKHAKPSPNKSKSGGIIKIEVPVCFSNVAIINTITNKRDKVFFKFLSNGKKVRVFKSNKEILK